MCTHVSLHILSFRESVGSSLDTVNPLNPETVIQYLAFNGGVCIVFQVTGESEGLHDDKDFKETFRPATDNRASNVSSFDKDKIGENRVEEKAASKITPKNQNSNVPAFEMKFSEGNHRDIRKDALEHSESSTVNKVLKNSHTSSVGTAIGKAEMKSSEASQPVVRGRNIDLQSKLRDLMKCGSSTNTTNPFASKKLETPPPVQQQPGNNKKYFVSIQCTMFHNKDYFRTQEVCSTSKINSTYLTTFV